MSQQKEHKHSNLKLPETLPSCPQSLHLSPLPLSSTTDSDESIPLNKSTVISDMVLSPEKNLKRRREKEVSRCSCNGCKKKLGLMGFRCRCGDMFCSEHRYSDRHACSFDYKAAGKEIIAKENPLVRAPKLVKV